MRKGNTWAACTIFGVAPVFIISYFTNPGVGFPAGTLLGVGAAFLLTSFARS